MCAAHKTQLNRTYGMKKSGNKEGQPLQETWGESCHLMPFFPSFLRFFRSHELPDGAEFLSFKSTLRRRRLCINMRGQYLDTLTWGSCNTGNGPFLRRKSC